jgi:hypothetical protein
MNTKTRKGAGAASKAAHAPKRKATPKKKPPAKASEKAIVSPPSKRRPPKGAGGKPGNRNAAKWELPELPEIHRQLITHLEQGGGWNTFEWMSKQSITQHLAKNLPEFPEEPVRAAHRRGTQKLLNIAHLTAMGKISGNARLLVFLLRNKGVSDQPPDPALEELPTTEQKSGESGAVVPPRIVVVFEDAKPPEVVQSDT